MRAERIPGFRLKGATGEVAEPPEYAGKWTFEVKLLLDGHGDGEPLINYGTVLCDTEGEADKELEKAVGLALRELQKRLGVDPNGLCLDLKTNTFKHLTDQPHGERDA